MYEFDGGSYPLTRTPYSGKPAAYVVNGITMYELPRGKVYVGYIECNGDIYTVYRSSYKAYLFLLAVPLLIALVAFLTSRSTTVEYQVAFAQYPFYSDNILECAVVNVSDVTYSVQFTDGTYTTGVYTIEPGDTLFQVEVDFAPTHIIFDGEYKFELEVRE